MHDPLLVRVFERVAHFDQDPVHLFLVNDFLIDQCSQRKPVHIFQQKIIEAAGLAEIEDVDDVGMVQSRQRLRLARETPCEGGVARQLRRENFQATARLSSGWRAW